MAVANITRYAIDAFSREPGPVSGRGPPGAAGYLAPGANRGTIGDATREGVVMIGIEHRVGVGHEPRSRRSDEIRLLQQLWDVPAPVERKPWWRLSIPSWAFPAGLALSWLTFLTVLFATAPASDPAATPLWAQQLAGFMFLVLLATPIGFLYRFAGFGMSGLAGLSGAALGVGCFTAGHTGAWPMFQLTGFAALALVSAIGAGRSLRRR